MVYTKESSERVALLLFIHIYGDKHDKARWYLNGWNFFEKEKNKYRERKCLTCQEKSIMEKNMFMCRRCKENNIRYGNVDSYKVHT